MNNATDLNTTLSPLLEALSDDKYDKYPDAYAIERVWYYTVGVAGSLVGVVGVICNILSLGVLARKEMRSTASLYLIAVAIYDLVFLLFNTTFVSVEYFHFGLTGLRDWLDSYVIVAIPVVQTLLNIGVTASVYTTIILSIDRATGITYPLKWPRVCTQSRVIMALCVILLWAVVFNIPFMMEYEWVTITDPDTNESVLTITETSYSKTFFHNEVYLRFINPIFDSVIPILVIATVNIIIATTLHRRLRKSGTMNASHNHSSQKVSRDTTRITAQVVFISIMTLIARAFRMAMFVLMEYHDTMMVNFCPLHCGVVAALSQFFSILNATVNFFCYCYFGPKFRRCFMKTYIYHGCCKDTAGNNNQRKFQGQSSRLKTTVSSLSTYRNASYNLENVSRPTDSTSNGSSGVFKISDFERSC